VKAMAGGLPTKRTGSSRYVGVSRRKETGRWIAQSGSGMYRVHLGSFDTEAEAAEALAAHCREDCRQGCRRGLPP